MHVLEIQKIESSKPLLVSCFQKGSIIPYSSVLVTRLLLVYSLHYFLNTMSNPELIYSITDYLLGAVSS